jgi:hypothetical protein
VLLLNRSVLVRKTGVNLLSMELSRRLRGQILDRLCNGISMHADKVSTRG